MNSQNTPERLSSLLYAIEQSQAEGKSHPVVTIANGIRQYSNTVAPLPFDYAVKVDPKTKQAVFGYDLRLFQTQRVVRDVDDIYALSAHLKKNGNQLLLSDLVESYALADDSDSGTDATAVILDLGYHHTLDTAENLLTLNKTTIDGAIDAVIKHYEDGTTPAVSEMLYHSLLTTLGGKGSAGLLQKAKEYLVLESPYLSEDEISERFVHLQSVIDRQTDTMVEGIRLMSLVEPKNQKRIYKNDLLRLHDQFNRQFEITDDQTDKEYFNWVNKGVPAHYMPERPSGMSTAHYMGSKVREIVSLASTHPEKEDLSYYKSFLTK